MAAIEHSEEISAENEANIIENMASVSVDKDESKDLHDVTMETDVEQSIGREQQPCNSENVQVCEFYKQGKCRFGEECNNLHVGEVANLSPKSKKKARKNKLKPKEDLIIGKKPPMKTAGDVRDRILWDSDLPSEYFTLGYVDRFMGIVEKPFSSFVWGDLCDAGPEDLAIPQHCMSYFKYKGTKVWDKATRMDHVFGSAGNNMKIMEKMVLIDEELRKKPEEHNSDDESDDSDGEFDVMLSGNAGVLGVGKQIVNDLQETLLRATHFLCIKVKDPFVIQEAIKVQESVYMNDSTIRNCVMPKELFHVTLAMIRCETVSSFESVRKLLDELQPMLQQLVAGTDSHANPTDVAECKSKDSSQRSLVANGLSTFGARVLYVRLNVPDSFNRAVEIIEERIRTMPSVTITNNFGFVPHMTLIKVNRQTERERRSKYMDSYLYDDYLDHRFGVINFDNIHFCSIEDMRGPDRFYQTMKIISF